MIVPGFESHLFRHFRGLAACPRLLLPTFHRLRADKEFTPQTVRLAQLTAREIASPELINRDLPALEGVRRDVCTKESKGPWRCANLSWVGGRPLPEHFRMLFSGRIFPPAAKPRWKSQLYSPTPKHAPRRW